MVSHRLVDSPDIMRTPKLRPNPTLATICAQYTARDSDAPPERLRHTTTSISPLDSCRSRLK